MGYLFIRLAWIAAVAGGAALIGYGIHTFKNEPGSRKRSIILMSVGGILVLIVIGVILYALMALMAMT